MSTPSPAKYFNVFIDSDGPVADFDKALKASGLTADEFKHRPGVYLWLDITEGAVSALDFLKKFDDRGWIRVWIATKTPSQSPYAYTEKVMWYAQNFPWLEDRVILSHDKSILGRPEDFITDDRPNKANVINFPGTFIRFDVENPADSWIRFIDAIEERLAEHAENEAVDLLNKVSGQEVSVAKAQFAFPR